MELQDDGYGKIELHNGGNGQLDDGGEKVVRMVLALLGLWVLLSIFILWFVGYFGEANCFSSLEVEIRAIYRGLSIMLEKGLQNVTIESDSSVAVKLCNEGAPLDHAHRYIVEEARKITGSSNVTISHIFRQANQVADCLARLGSQQEDDDLFVTKAIPFAAREFVLADAMGIGHLRT